MTINAREFDKQLKLEYAKYINSVITKINGRLIKRSILPIIEHRLLASDTFRSIVSGGLHGMFGFYEGTQFNYITNIIDRVLDEVTVTIHKIENKKGNISISCDIYIFDSDTTSTFSMTEATIHADGTQLEWWRWLMLEGQKKIVTGFHVVFGESEYSRSGKALMFKGGDWGVPAKHAGDNIDNWITRALSVRIGKNYEPIPEFKAAIEKALIDEIQGLL